MSPDENLVNLEQRVSRHQEILQSLEANCESLPLCEIPTDIVIGQGNLGSDVMFIGEAPGAEEAKQRIPFVGRGGQLLNRTLEAAGMKREDFYVSNLVKVRPPGNRDPSPEEINAFLPYLLEEIELIQPKLFVTLGRFSMNFFLPEAKISAVHGNLQRFWWQDRITYLLPVYHPAAALRSTNMKTAFEADIAKIPKALEYITQQQETDLQLQQVKSSLF
jgi:uracil-DNA glycosylase family 4